MYVYIYIISHSRVQRVLVPIYSRMYICTVVNVNTAVVLTAVMYFALLLLLCMIRTILLLYYVANFHPASSSTTSRIIYVTSNILRSITRPLLGCKISCYYIQQDNVNKTKNNRKKNKASSAPRANKQLQT